MRHHGEGSQSAPPTLQRRLRNPAKSCRRKVTRAASPAIAIGILLVQTSQQLQLLHTFSVETFMICTVSLLMSAQPELIDSNPPIGSSHGAAEYFA